jgi:hypothetical protein
MCVGPLQDSETSGLHDSKTLGSWRNGECVEEPKELTHKFSLIPILNTYWGFIKPNSQGDIF